MLADITARKKRLEQKMQELAVLWNSQLPAAMESPKRAGIPFTSNVGYGNTVSSSGNYRDLPNLLSQIESQKLSHISNARNFLSKGSIAAVVSRHNALKTECELLLKEILMMEDAMKMAGLYLIKQGIETDISKMPLYIRQMILEAVKKGNQKNLIALLMLGGVKKLKMLNKDSAFIERIIFGASSGDVSFQTKVAKEATRQMKTKLKKRDGQTFTSVSAVRSFIESQDIKVQYTIKDTEIEANVGGKIIKQNLTSELMPSKIDVKKPSFFEKMFNSVKGFWGKK